MHILQQSTALNHIRILSKVRKAMITIQVCCIVIKAYLHELIDYIFVSFGGALLHESSYLLQDFEETQTHMSIKINRLEEGHNSYPLVCRRPPETAPEFLPLIYPPEL
jgi:hypothetical protein